MNLCEYCGKEHDGAFASGRFCNRGCCNGFSTKIKRKEINEKVKITLKTKFEKPSRICPICFCEYNKRQRKTCSSICGDKLRIQNTDFAALSLKGKERCSSLDERLRLRDIGRSGGFGKKGVTDCGTEYQSTIEKECFEYLENNFINFEPHKHLPNSSKVSDVYLIDKDIWVEIDGIDREKKKVYPSYKKHYEYWLDKLNQYKERNLKYVIVKSLEEFIRIA